MGKSNKGMAKILSIVLALCMVVSMLPETLASATESVTYDFTAATDAVNGTVYSDATTGANWKYGYTYHSYYRATLKELDEGKYLEINPSNKASRKKGTWFAFKVDAPAAGVYTASLVHAQLEVTDGFERQGDVYFVPASKVTKPTEDIEFEGLLTDDTYKIHDSVKYSNTTGNAVKTTALSGEIIVSGDETQYYVVFRKPMDEVTTYGENKTVFEYNTSAEGDVYTSNYHAQQYPVALSLTKTSEIVKKYKFEYDFNHVWEKDTDLKGKTYADTCHSWEFAAARASDVTVSASAINRDYMYIGGSGKAARTPGLWAAVKVKTPIAGEYTATLIHGQVKDSPGVGDVYWIPVNSAPNGIASVIASDADAADPYKIKDDVKYGLEGGNDWEAKTELGNVTVKSGDTEHYVVFRVPLESTASQESTDASYFQMFPASLTLTAGTSLAYMGTNINVASELTIGDTAAVSVTGYLSDGSSEGITYGAVTSDNEEVLSVSNGTVTALSAGTATLSCAVTYDGTVVETVTKTVTVVDKAATEEVVGAIITFAATSNIGGDGITVTIPNYEYTIGNPDSTIAAGTSITLEATGKTGYIFRGWKRGSEADGVMISNAESYTFPLFTNTVITAIYEAEQNTATTPSVEFYNFNGQFIESKEVNGQAFSALKPEKAKEPTLTGYSFDFWTMDGENEVDGTEVFTALTRVMAKFSVAATTYAVDIGDGISGAADDKYAYDKKLELSANEEGTWYVNNKPVAYGSAYNHYVFGTANITFEAGENNGAPILSLDTAIGGAAIISYAANGADIVEVGIIFGDGTPTIGSFTNGKAASKHTGKGISGQFTATGYDGTSTGARGYLIYNDKGTYRVIYAG